MQPGTFLLPEVYRSLTTPHASIARSLDFNLPDSFLVLSDLYEEEGKAELRDWCRQLHVLAQVVSDIKVTYVFQDRKPFRYRDVPLRIVQFRRNSRRIITRFEINHQSWGECSLLWNKNSTSYTSLSRVKKCLDKLDRYYRTLWGPFRHRIHETPPTTNPPISGSLS